ncbi:MAG: glycosyltransferase [Chromatiales bacterium]|jgi:glycosyltransferase involved in cell wall biosynthesis
MRILMISDVYFPRVNGVSTSIQTFAREFTREGHEVTLLAPDYGGPAPAEQELEVLRIPARRLPVDPEDRMLRRPAIRRRLPEIAGRGYDLVHIHTPFVAHYSGLGLARALDLPVVESYHTYFEEYLDKYLPWMPRGPLRFAARRFSASQCNAVDALVVPSSAMLEVLRRYGVRTRAEVIPTGINLDLFQRGDGDRFRLRLGIPPERPVLVHVGRIAHEKNIDFLIDVVERVRRSVPDILLLVAGEGPARRRLEGQVRDRGLNGAVLFLGYLSRDGELQDCYCSGDAFVFSSHTETQGLVLLEAMALGVPVVSTARMGVRDVLKDGAGALIAEPELEDFAAKTERVLTDPALGARLGAAGAAYARGWTAPELARRKLDYYWRVIGERASRPAA